jgi:hypothetical protein
MSLSAVHELGPVRHSPPPKKGRDEVGPFHPVPQEFLPQKILVTRLKKYRL